MGDQRFQALANDIGFDIKLLEPYRPSIEKMLDFVKNTDEKLHELDEKTKYSFFLTATLHYHIPSDLRSMIILTLTHQNYQLNIVLRHFLECFMITLWGDLFAGFRDTFDYLLKDKEWKPYRAQQRVMWEFNKSFPLPDRSIKERLERIRLLNWVKKEGKDYYKEYLSK